MECDASFGVVRSLAPRATERGSMVVFWAGPTPKATPTTVRAREPHTIAGMVPTIKYIAKMTTIVFVHLVYSLTYIRTYNMLF